MEVGEVMEVVVFLEKMDQKLIEVVLMQYEESPNLLYIMDFVIDALFK